MLLLFSLLLPAVASDAARSAWRDGLTLQAAQRQLALAASTAAGETGAPAAAAAPALTQADLLAWHALAHPDAKVLTLVR
jgi:hypothetical protein